MPTVEVSMRMSYLGLRGTCVPPPAHTNRGTGTIRSNLVHVIRIISDDRRFPLWVPHEQTDPVVLAVPAVRLKRTREYTDAGGRGHGVSQSAGWPVPGPSVTAL